MSTLTLIDDLTQFETYLKGGRPRLLKLHLRNYDHHLEDLEHNYKQQVISSNPAAKAKAEQILANLNVPQPLWKSYLDDTFYNLLLRLNREAHPQIAYILKLIDSKFTINKLDLLSVGGALGLTIFAIYTMPIFANAAAFLQTFFTSAIGLPVLGLMYTVAGAALNFYQRQVDARQNLFHRIRDNFFLLSNTAINVTAYGFWIAAAAPMTPLVATLFVLASAVDVVKEIAGLAQEYFRFYNRPNTQNASEKTIAQENARSTFGFNKHRNAFLINLAASIFLVGIMAAWCFIPGGLIITIGAVLAIAMVHLIKQQALKLNESSIRNELQDELRKIEETYPEEVDVPDVSPSLNTLIQNQDESHQQKEQLPPSPPTPTIPAAEQHTPTIESEFRITFS